MKTIFIKLFTVVLSLGLSVTSYAQERVFHDFNDGKFYPYEVPKRDQEDRVKT